MMRCQTCWGKGSVCTLTECKWPDIEDACSSCYGYKKCLVCDGEGEQTDNEL